MIRLTTAQAKNYGSFKEAKILEISDSEYSVQLINDSVAYEILDLTGKVKIYKSISTAAQFAKSAGVSSAHIIFQ